MVTKPPSQNIIKENLKAHAANLKVETMRLIEDAERRLSQEKDRWTWELPDMRRQELRNILTSLMVPLEKHVARAEARLQVLQEDPLSVGTHAFLLAQKEAERRGNEKAA